MKKKNSTGNAGLKLPITILSPKQPQVLLKKSIYTSYLHHKEGKTTNSIMKAGEATLEGQTESQIISSYKRELGIRPPNKTSTIIDTIAFSQPTTATHANLYNNNPPKPVRTYLSKDERGKSIANKDHIIHLELNHLLNPSAAFENSTPALQFGSEGMDAKEHEDYYQYLNNIENNRERGGWIDHINHIEQREEETIVGGSVTDNYPSNIKSYPTTAEGTKPLSGIHGGSLSKHRAQPQPVSTTTTTKQSRAELLPQGVKSRSLTQIQKSSKICIPRIPHNFEEVIKSNLQKAKERVIRGMRKEVVSQTSGGTRNGGKSKGRDILLTEDSPRSRMGIGNINNQQAPLKSKGLGVSIKLKTGNKRQEIVNQHQKSPIRDMELIAEGEEEIEFMNEKLFNTFNSPDSPSNLPFHTERGVGLDREHENERKGVTTIIPSLSLVKNKSSRANTGNTKIQAHRQKQSDHMPLFNSTAGFSFANTLLQTTGHPLHAHLHNQQLIANVNTQGGRLRISGRSNTINPNNLTGAIINSTTHSHQTTTQSAIVKGGTLTERTNRNIQDNSEGGTGITKSHIKSPHNARPSLEGGMVSGKSIIRLVSAVYNNATGSPDEGADIKNSYNNPLNREDTGKRDSGTNANPRKHPPSTTTSRRSKHPNYPKRRSISSGRPPNPHRYKGLGGIITSGIVPQDKPTSPKHNNQNSLEGVGLQGPPEDTRGWSLTGEHSLESPSCPHSKDRLGYTNKDSFPVLTGVGLLSSSKVPGGLGVRGNKGGHGEKVGGGLGEGVGVNRVRKIEIKLKDDLISEFGKLGNMGQGLGHSRKSSGLDITDGHVEYSALEGDNTSWAQSPNTSMPFKTVVTNPKYNAEIHPPENILQNLNHTPDSRRRTGSQQHPPGRARPVTHGYINTNPNTQQYRAASRPGRWGTMNIIPFMAQHSSTEKIGIKSEIHGGGDEGEEVREKPGTAMCRICSTYGSGGNIGSGGNTWLESSIPLSTGAGTGTGTGNMLGDSTKGFSFTTTSTNAVVVPTSTQPPPRIREVEEVTPLPPPLRSSLIREEDQKYTSTEEQTESNLHMQKKESNTSEGPLCIPSLGNLQDPPSPIRMSKYKRKKSEGKYRDSPRGIVYSSETNTPINRLGSGMKGLEGRNETQKVVEFKQGYYSSNYVPSAQFGNFKNKLKLSDIGRGNIRHRLLADENVESTRPLAQSSYSINRIIRKSDKSNEEMHPSTSKEGISRIPIGVGEDQPPRNNRNTLANVIFQAMDKLKENNDGYTEQLDLGEVFYPNENYQNLKEKNRLDKIGENLQLIGKFLPKQFEKSKRIYYEILAKNSPHPLTHTLEPIQSSGKRPKTTSMNPMNSCLYSKLLSQKDEIKEEKQHKIRDDKNSDAYLHHLAMKKSKLKAHRYNVEFNKMNIIRSGNKRKLK